MNFEKSLKKKILHLTFLTGLILFAINLYGFFIPLKNEEIKKQLKNRDIESLLREVEYIFSSPMSMEAKVIKINNFVHDNIIYNEKSPYLKVSFYENYILYLMAIIFPSRFKYYEFSDYKKALERGTGSCSQFAIVISEILRGNKINSKIIRLKGHVVAYAEINNHKWWVLDPTYGVIIKHPIENIEQNLDLAVVSYKNKGYNEETEGWEYIISNYDKRGNIVFAEGVIGFHGLYYYFEKISYILKWIIPFLLTLPFIEFYSKKINFKIH
jgi:hypothetical protein